MFGMIVTGLVVTGIVALIFAALLQFASRVIFGESIEFGDAFKVALPAIAAMGILNRFLLGDLEPWVLGFALRQGITWLLWFGGLAVIVGLRVRQAALVALVMQGVLFGLALLANLIRAGI